MSILLAFGLAYLSNSAFALSFDSLKELIQQKKIKSVEQLLPQLPESLRSRYILMFNSRSLQGATYEDPRVLLFGGGAGLVASFNGAAQQKGFQAFETMEFNPESRKFTFHEIEFSPNRGPSFSSANPEKCIKCHGSPSLRPIWDTYPLWPGAYGERALAPLSPAEKTGITKFLAAQPKHPRYQYLIQTEIFAKQETFSPSHENRYNGRQSESPNEEFSRQLGLMNQKRIVQQVRSAEQIDAYRYALLASVSLDCENIEYSIPETFRKGYLEQLKEFSTRSDEINIEQDRLKQLRSVSLEFKLDKALSSEITPLNAFRFLAETGLGLSTREWTTALEAETYDFALPHSVASELEKLLLADLARSDDTLSRLAALRRVSSSEKYCDYLRKKSLFVLPPVLNKSTFAQAAIQAAVHRAMDIPKLVKKCAECHDGTAGPTLPFDHPDQLVPLLSKGSYPRGSLLNEIAYRLSSTSGSDRMPRGLNITEDERQNLEAYFRGLINVRKAQIRLDCHNPEKAPSWTARDKIQSEIYD